MTKSQRKHLALFRTLATIVCLILLTNPAHSNESIQWIVAEEPPITYLRDGEFTGYGMEMLRQIQKEMVGYTHEVSIAGNYKRVIREVTEGPLTCNIGLFRTPERERIMEFSEVPFFYFFNIQIAMKKTLFSKLGEPDSISFRNMLESKRYMLGLSVGRTYSESLRDILDENKKDANIFWRPQSGVAEGLFNMLLRDRIDYMLLYPDEAMYLSLKADAKDEIITVPIKEAFDLSYAWCACTKSQEGKKAASAISAALIKIRPQESYRAPYEKWISPNLVDLYTEKFLNEFLLIKE